MNDKQDFDEAALRQSAQRLALHTMVMAIIATHPNKVDLELVMRAGSEAQFEALLAELKHLDRAREFAQQAFDQEMAYGYQMLR